MYRHTYIYMYIPTYLYRDVSIHVYNICMYIYIYHILEMFVDMYVVHYAKTMHAAWVYTYVCVLS